MSASAAAGEHASCYRLDDGHLVPVQPADGSINPRAELVHDQLRSLITSRKFSCLGAKAALNGGDYWIGVTQDNKKARELGPTRGPRCMIMIWLSQIDEHVVALELHFEFLGGQCGDQFVFARRHVVAPAMPGTDDRRAVEFAFGERAAAVAADVIDRIELAVDIEHAHCFAIDLDALAASCFDFTRGADFNEIRHH